ncbi:MAG: IS21-like element helper ATPase IstB [Bacteroidales bacterium]|nr:IS21-like element helper ATPase IstB [Bacteroidales bacterium]
MNTQETILQLEDLKLKGMAECYKALQTMPVNEWPTLDQFVARLAEAERQYRNQRRTEMYLKTSRLRYNTVLEDVICSEERNLSKDMLLSLMDCGFIDRAENVLVDGKTGCGKSFLVCALGRQACFLGHRVEYFSMNKFIERIALAKLDGSLLKVINHIEKNDLVIFDDFGLQPLDNNSRLALLQILEDCYQRKSVIVTSQLPVAKWYDYINEPTLADAIMDRLCANAHRIELKGDSLRRKNQKKS